MQKIAYYNSPVGQILLASDEQGLTGLWLHSDRFYADNLAKDHQLGKNKYLDDAIRWLDLYFAGKDPNFLPIALIVPCHRVISSHGDLTGYSGGIDKKIQLLQLEGIDISKFSLPANYK